jgi:hypothetical protein
MGLVEAAWEYASSAAVAAAAHPFVASVFVGVLLLCAVVLSFGAQTWKNPAALQPKSYPIIGHFAMYFKMFTHPRSYDMVHENLQRYAPDGRTWQLTLPRFPGIGSGQVYFINSPDVLQHVLQTNFRNYEKGPNFRSIFQDFLGKGIFSTDGATWKVHRKIGSHMFSRKLNILGVTVATEQVSRLLACLDKAARHDQAVDIKDLFYRLTITVFSSMAFGHDLAAISPDHAAGPEGGVQTHPPQHAFAQARCCALLTGSVAVGAVPVSRCVVACVRASALLYPLNECYFTTVPLEYRGGLRGARAHVRVYLCVVCVW